MSTRRRSRPSLPRSFYEFPPWKTHDSRNSRVRKAPTCPTGQLRGLRTGGGRWVIGGGEGIVGPRRLLPRGHVSEAAESRGACREPCGRVEGSTWARLAVNSTQPEELTHPLQELINGAASST